VTRDQTYTEIAAIEGAALNLALATDREMDMADQRALVKDAGIKRLMAAGTFGSVTAAEKGIEFDAEYMAHRKLEREAVANRIVMQAKYDAAKLRARLAVELSGYSELVAAEEESIQQHALDKLDRMLDDAGVKQKRDDGQYLGVVQRLELLLAQRAARQRTDLAKEPV
jgi:hypothetical protein